MGDFGLVTALSEQEDSSAQRLTRQKSGDNHTAQVGTHIYMSPEQVRGQLEELAKFHINPLYSS